jgi:ring-1,2-phenylacetyl-CoA epoxidase subunit PaaB
MSYDVPHMEGEAEVGFAAADGDDGWPRWEVFVRQGGGLTHVYSESVHAPDAETALLNARDTYLRRIEGVSLWVTPAAAVTAWESDQPDPAAPGETGGESILWEVFVRHRRGLAHVHAGSLPAATSGDAITRARQVYVTRDEGVSVWVIPSSRIYAADPADAEAMFAPFRDKEYRYPTYYDIPDEVGYM